MTIEVTTKQRVAIMFAQIFEVPKYFLKFTAESSAVEIHLALVFPL